MKRFLFLKTSGGTPEDEFTTDRTVYNAMPRRSWKNYNRQTLSRPSAIASQQDGRGRSELIKKGVHFFSWQCSSFFCQSLLASLGRPKNVFSTVRTAF